MKAPYDNYTVDGQVYEKNQEVWDLGLWRHNPSDDSRYDYTGHENVAKLPPYVSAGTTAFDPVTGVAYCAYADPNDENQVLWHEV